MKNISESKTEYTPERFKKPSDEIKLEHAQKRYYFGAMLTILTVIISLALIFVLLPRPTQSFAENRTLTPFPTFSAKSYLDGSFTKNLTKWFADTVPFRDNIVELSSRIKELEGIRQDNIRFHGNVNIVNTDEVHYITQAAENNEPALLPGEAGAPLNGDNPAQFVVTPAQTDIEPSESGSMEFINNGIITIDDRSIMLFGGNRVQGKYYADVLNAYKIQMGEEVNIYSMVVPTAVEFYLPEKYSEYSGSEKTQIDYIYQNLVGVTPIDAYSKLAAHTDEAIYLKTDHHWAQLGAYYASTAFAETLGEAVQPISDYEQVTREGYVGSLYGYTNDIAIKENPEQFVYYRQPLPYETYFYDFETLASKGKGQLIYESASVDNSYGMFLGSDAIHIKVVTENKNGKKLCVFKDSFGNALIPELVPYFEEIYVIDFRYFGMSAVDYMKEKGITDVLFVNNIFAANTGSLINGLNTMRTGPYNLIQIERERALLEAAQAAEQMSEQGSQQGSEQVSDTNFDG
jgi:hypothetical protein